MSESGSQLGSIRSGTTGTMSETSSQRSDTRMLRKHKRSGEEKEEGDLLEQKRSFQEGVFSCMYTLVRQSAFNNWQIALVKVLLEGLMPFIVVFNPSSAWLIDTNNPIWQVVRWAVWRSPIMRLYGYDTYIIVMYVMAAAVLLSVVGLVWLTLLMRRQEQSKWLRKVAVLLNVVYELIFVIFYVSFFDYFVFAANCHFGDDVKMHEYFEGVNCLSMPHVLHMSVALVTAVVHFLVTALMVVASCDLNPVSRGRLASPDAYSRLKILAGKAIFIIAADDLQSWPRPQALVVCVAAAFVCWWNFRKLPFYRMVINVVWCSLWVGVLFTSSMLAALVFSADASSKEKRQDYTMYILYGIFPTIAGSMVVCWVHGWWAMRPAKRFQELTSFRNVRLEKAYKFADVHEVEVLSRVMRRFDTDGVVLEDAAAHGEAVIKGGMHAFPHSPFLYILYANFLMEVRRDAPAARTQLQLALKHGPTLVERYQVYCTLEASKRLRDGQDGGGMDLQAYIEFRRNFKAVLRVHKEVLLLEVELWRMCQRSALRVAALDAMMDELELATERANQVYRRVLERYPTNGKLLRCYGKFLEDVRHDAVAATRAYSEAARNGGADAIMSLDLSAVQQAAGKPEFLTSMSLVDDAVVVINAEGDIMMVSQAVQSVFGYAKCELEGANVSLLMPQPFSQRHPSYLSRYLATGEAHILDSVREVVALHKDCYVFPIQLSVTKMSGSGADSVFLGVLRPLPPNCHRMRAWLAPSGVFLCGDQQFASLCGLSEKELVGRPLASLVANTDAEVVALLDRFRTASESELEAGLVRFELQLRHRYLAPVDVEVTLGLGGTDDQRILALSCRRTDGRDGTILVVDTHMRIRFASLGVGALLNIPVRRLAAMRLDQLLPPPYNTMHAKWLRDPPHASSPTSCRSGRVVHLLNEAGSQVPVRIKVHNGSGGDVAMSLYVVQVEKVSAEELMDEKRMVLSADLSGRVQAVSRPDSALFGFPASQLVGWSLCDCVDIFGEWRQRNGDSQLQLLILALVDREQELPGTSWRVRVQRPGAQEGQQEGGREGLPPLMGLAPSMRRKHVPASVSACLQIELVSDDGTHTHLPSDSSPVHDEDDVLARLAAASSFGRPPTAGDAFAADAAAAAAVGAARLKLTLWRRDLLTGVVELDEHMVVRKASPMTGLVVGLPATAMLKKPLSRFLDLPSHQSWEAIAAAHTRTHKRSALKSSTDRGILSPPMAFIGPHPDMGTMRVVLQGVQTLAPGGRNKVTAVLHPDTTFVGAHANVLRVLKLEDVAALDSAAAAVRADPKDDDKEEEEGRGGGDASGGKGREIKSAAGGKEVKKGKGKDGGKMVKNEEGWGHQQEEEEEEEQEEEAAGSVPPAGGRTLDRPPSGSSRGAREQLGSRSEEGSQSGSGSSDDDSRSDDGEGGTGRRRSRPAPEVPELDPEAQGQAQLHRRASSKSDFVAQWVRTVSNRALIPAHERAPTSPQTDPDQQPPPPPEEGARLALPAPPSRVDSAPRAAVASRSGRLAAIPEDARGPSDDDDEAISFAKDLDRRHRHRNPDPSSPSRLAAPPPPDAVGADAAAAGGGGGGGGDKWERGSEGGDSSADGSQAASGITGITDQQSSVDMMVDARRGKLLKSLSKVLLGPVLTVPLERLRLHTYGMLALMLIAHVVCYVVVTRIISREHSGVYIIFRQAMAMDRAQLLVVRILIGTYCERANITARTSACTPPLSTHLANMRASVQSLEEYHQAIYLGLDPATVAKPDGKVYDIWTNPVYDYHTYMDIQPPQVLTQFGGVWQLGNKFIAASREALYWMPKLRSLFKLHRVYHFMVANGLGALFTGYATSLDMLMDAAWRSLDTLRMDLLVLLVVEVLFVQLLCLSYEWVLIHRVEQARMLGVMCMLGLPGPVLRQLVNKEVKVLDESDDDDADSDNAADEDATARAAGRVAAGGGQRGREGEDGGSTGGAGVATTAGGGALVPHSAATAAEADDAKGGGGGSPSKARTVRHSKSTKNGGGGGGDGSGSDRDGLAGAIGGGGGSVWQERVASEEGYGRHKGGGMMSREDTDAESSGPYESNRGELALAAIGLSTAKYDKYDPASKPRRSRWHGMRAYGVQLINGKALMASRWRELRFMMLLLLWFAGVLSIYVLSIVKLTGMQAPLASLNMACHVTYRYTRVRAIGFAFLAQDDDASRAIWREMLATEVRHFRSEYEALMYGGTAMSQVGGLFTHPVPPSTFASADFANEFFRTKRCFRYNQTLCTKAGTPYYEVTHNGLDVMVRRMIVEMELLIEDADVDVMYNGTRWTFMYNVGTFDLYEGLQQAAQMFVDYSISRYSQVLILHTILLIASIAVVLLYIVFVLWPHLAKFKADAARQSALLSHVPPEVDTVGLVRATCRMVRTSKRRMSRQGNKGAAAPVPGSSGAAAVAAV